MSTDYRLSKKVTFQQLLRGLEPFGITKVTLPEETTVWLTDGEHYFFVDGYQSEGGDVFVRKLTIKSWENANRIFFAIAEACDVDIFSEDEPQYWGYESPEELLAEHQAQKKNRNGYFDELMRYARGEPTDIPPGAAHATLAHIATVVATRQPELATPHSREEFFDAMVDELLPPWCPEKFDSWAQASKPRGSRAAHESSGNKEIEL